MRYARPANPLMFCLLLGASLSVAADWPQFRGPNGDANGTDAAPAAWGEASNIAWTADLPGEGWSSPIVVGSKVLLTSATPAGEENYRFELHCLSLDDGALLWSRTVVESPTRTPIHRDNSYATETPASDGKRVVAYFGMHGCACYDLQGNQLWLKDLGSYPMHNGWGPSSSPVIADGLVFIQLDNEEDAHLVALDLKTGEPRWRAERDGEQSNWCTPLVWRNSKRTELVVGGKTVRSYDPATGGLLWSMPIGGRSSATPTAVGDSLVIGSENRVRRGGTPGGLFAVAAGASGEINVFDPIEESGARKQGLLWSNLSGAIGISSPVVANGLVFAPARARGVVVVHDLKTGEELAKERLRGGAKFWASPWVAGGKVFLLDEAGKTFVVEPTTELRVEATNALPGRFWSSPAIADDTLLLRSQEKLFAIRQ